MGRLRTAGAGAKSQGINGKCFWLLFLILFSHLNAQASKEDLIIDHNMYHAFYRFEFVHFLLVS